MEERKELTIEEIHEGTIGILKKIIELCSMIFFRMPIVPS